MLGLEETPSLAALANSSDGEPVQNRGISLPVCDGHSSFLAVLVVRTATSKINADSKVPCPWSSSALFVHANHVTFYPRPVSKMLVITQPWT